MMPKLKSCPLCDSAALEEPLENEQFLKIFCSNKLCGCQIIQPSIHSAYRVWNSRPDGGDSLREALLKVQSELHLMMPHIVNGYGSNKYKAMDNIIKVALAAKEGEQ